MEFNLCVISLAGNKLAVGTKFLEFAIGENLLSFNQVGIYCNQSEGRGVGDEVIALCLSNGSLTAKTLELGESFNKSYHLNEEI